MIVTIKQLNAMRTGRARVMFVPLAKCSDWKTGRRVQVRRFLERTETRITSVPVKELAGPDAGARTAFTIVSLGDPVSLGDISLKEARAAGFKTVRDLRAHFAELFTTRERHGPIVPVLFEMVVDRPRFLTAKAHTLSTSDYTRSRHKAMRAEPEVAA